MPTAATIALLTKLEILDPEDQEELVEIGAQFGTEDVLLQIARFGEAATSTGAIPARYGFTAEDAADLTPVAEAITEISGVRVSKDVVRSTSTHDFRDTISRGKRAVSSGRTVLANAELALRRVPGAESKAARSLIRATTEKLGKAGRSKVKLSTQLQALRTTLGDASLAAALSARGGPEVITAIDAALKELSGKTAPGEKIRGNPMETRKLNLLEGHAVTILRQARAAAREWALERRDNTLGKAYELEFLYSSSKSEAPPHEPSTPSIPPVT